MKILVVPDVHLKPWIFEQASKLMQNSMAEQAVCLMDIADDWHQQYNMVLYANTYDAAIKFAKDFPETIWCYGNHDVCYLWNQRESGYSMIAPRIVCKKLQILKQSLPDEKQLAYIHRIDDVLFSHGGLADVFVRRYVPKDKYDDIDAVVKTINGFECPEMWQTISPIWLRPQYNNLKLYKSENILQVVGHTPVDTIAKTGNLISSDVFSTYQDGTPIGTQEFLILDTKSHFFEKIQYGK